MTKALRKAIMKRSELERKYVEIIRQVKTLNLTKNPKNLCSKLYERERKNISKG